MNKELPHPAVVQAWIDFAYNKEYPFAQMVATQHLLEVFTNIEYARAYIEQENRRQIEQAHEHGSFG